ncbi:MAG: cobaltochelatase subunit CobS, partial [Caulobacterales bacterium]
MTDAADALLSLAPDKKITAREAFGIDSDMEVPMFSARNEYVPDFDPAYRFDPKTTIAICAGFAF